MGPGVSVVNLLDKTWMQSEAAGRGLKNIVAQTEWVAKQNKLDMMCGCVGDNISIPIPMVNRG